MTTPKSSHEVTTLPENVGLCVISDLLQMFERTNKFSTLMFLLLQYSINNFSSPFSDEELLALSEQKGLAEVYGCSSQSLALFQMSPVSI